MNDKFNPNFYTDLADDSAMIQAAVDAAAKVGEAVTIPRLNQRTGKRIWEITTAIRLHDDSVIFLDNCHLRQMDLIDCNIFRNSNNGPPWALPGRTVSITSPSRVSATVFSTAARPPASPRKTSQRPVCWVPRKKVFSTL